MPEPGHLAGLDPALVKLPLGDRPVHPGHLYGDGTLQPGVEAPVHPPEAARSHQRIEPVAIDKEPWQLVIAGQPVLKQLGLLHATRRRMTPGS
jgi:hypothetical protein